MTVDVNSSARWEYVSTGGTTYAYDEKIFADTDLLVYVDGTLKTLTTHYTVTGAGDAGGGNVVFVTAPDVDAEVTILRDVPNEQDADFPSAGPFPSSTVEDALDKRTIVSQQVREIVDRALVFKASDQSLPSGELAELADLKGMILGFNSSTGAPEPYDPSGLDSATASVIGNGLEVVGGTTLQIDTADDSLLSVAAGLSTQLLMPSNVTSTAEYAESDKGHVIPCSGTFAYTLPDLSTLSASYQHFWLANIGTGVVTVTPTTDTINGNATWPVRANETVLVVGDAANTRWIVVGGQMIDADGDTGWYASTDDTAILIAGGAIVMTGAGGASIGAPTGGTPATQGNVNASAYYDDNVRLLPLIFSGSVATTSGSAIGFTDVLSESRQIILSINGVGTDGTAVPAVQFGTSGGYVATGYLAGCSRIVGATASEIPLTTGIPIVPTKSSGDIYYGTLIFNKHNESSNTWIGGGNITVDNSGVIATVHVSGQLALGAALDRVQLVTTDAFNAGSLNLVQT